VKRKPEDLLGANFWRRVVDYFVPAETLEAGGEPRTRARLVAAICTIGGLLTVVGGSLSPLALGLSKGIAVVNVIGGIFVFSAAFVLRRTGALRAVANLLLSIGLAMNSMLYLASGGTNQTALYAFAIIPLIAVLIAGPGVGIVWMALCSAVAAGLIHAPPGAFGSSAEFAVASDSQLTQDIVMMTIWVTLVGVLYDRVQSSAQRTAEQARRRAEESEIRLAQAFDANPDGIVIADFETGEPVECNAGFLAILGRSHAQVVGGLDWAAALGMADAQRGSVRKTLLETGRCDEIETTLPRDSAGALSLRVHARRIELEGRPCVLATVRDVTERARLEAQLRQAQKMEAVGQLAGSIAHDFNNMLTVIAGYAEHLSSSLSGELGEMAGEIQGAAERSADLTRRLLAFSRRQVLEPRTLDLNGMIRRIEKLLGRLIGETIAVDLDLATELGSVRADSGQMEQVIVNLAINARDAMPEGGTLRIETSNVVGRSDGPAEGAGWVRVRVADTGVGMEESTLHRVFEPFFTTKESGKGTGLGLSMAEGIVSQSGGEMTVRSQPGRGTVVEFLLPCVGASRRAEGREPAARDGSPMPGTGYLVLLVEDDEMVRRLASRSLRAVGYEVVEAGDGDEALRVFQGRADDVDLVLSDVVMPRMGGVELARALREIRPSVRVLLMSGYPNPREGRGAAIPAGEDLIQKPFSPSALRARVQERIEGDGDEPAPGLC